jgi:hypothetical protein
MSEDMNINSYLKFFINVLLDFIDDNKIIIDESNTRQNLLCEELIECKMCGVYYSEKEKHICEIKYLD